MDHKVANTICYRPLLVPLVLGLIRPVLLQLDLSDTS